MTRAPLLARRVETLLGTAVISTSPVAGGDVATATRVRLNDGTTAFAKTLPRPPADFFTSEAASLRWLAEVDDGVPVPDVLGVDDECLVLRWVEPGRPGAEAAVEFGHRLARTHAAGAPAHGSGPTGSEQQAAWIGKLPLPNRPAGTWAEFYATRRLLPYLKVAHDRDAVTGDDVTSIERLVGRLAELVPDEPPARLHGDLWNGNCIWAVDGGVHVVDAAAHGGHRETDLAMLSLFGLPHLARVLDAYADAAPLADGWEERQGIHQLHPLLVHACMFGGSYGARAGAVARTFA